MHFLIYTNLTNYLEFFSKTAKEYNLYIQPGTLPVKIPSGKFRNRACFFSPNGQHDYQDKIIITPSENALTEFSGGDKIKIFDTPYGKMGIVVCYDSEFPALVHLLAHKNDVKIILVPSYTDTMHGFYRVHLACRAHALEYQCYVVQACAHAKVNVCDFLDATAVGSAGIFAPPDDGFPENGILALGDARIYNELVGATLSLEKLDHVRANGQVRNFNDHFLLEKIQQTVNIEKINF